MKLINSLTLRKGNGERPKTIKFFTLGCKANQYDTQSIRERFLKRGFQETLPGKLADYFLINTCTVTSGADQKSRQIIRRCIQINPQAKIIVTGCLAEHDWKLLANIPGIDLIVKKSFFPEGVSSFSQHTRAFLKIQDGCSNFCTYCKVALVRGKEKSKPLDQVLKEAQALVANGYQEIVLTGICLGAYGRDFIKKIDLADCYARLEEISGLKRIRLSSLEAGDISAKLLRHLAHSKKFCRHLHIPIQSGDNQILKSMNRKYTRKKYLSLIKRIKRQIPGIAITTDCLVGFPGEGDKNFKQTLDLVGQIQPLKVHIFSYSTRSGTRAEHFSGAVKPEVINIRCKELERLSQECAEKFKCKFIGAQLSILIETRNKENPAYLTGLTDNYLKVNLPFKPGLRNKIVLVKLRQLVGDDFYAEYIDKK